MKTKLTLISLFLELIVGNTVAQDPNQEYTNAMNSVFAKVDKSKIATGLLADYGLQIVDVEAFNGVPTDSNYVDMAKSGKVQFNVSNLPNGFYYLHIYENINEKPTIQQIIVKH